MLQVDRDLNPTEVGALRTLASSQQHIDDIKMQATEQEKKTLRTRYGIKETPNPILSLDVDVYQ